MGFLSPSDWANATGGDKGSSWEQMLTMAAQKEEADRLRAQQRGDTAPFLQLGQWGAGEMQNVLQNGYDPNNDPNYGFAKAEMAQSMDRQLRAQGRANSSYGMNAMGKAYGDLASKTYQNRLNALMGATNVGQGTAATNTGANSNNQNLTSSYYNQMLANQQQNQFNSQQQGYNNMAAGTNALGTAAKVYDYGKQNNWWGSDAGGNYDTPATTTWSANDWNTWNNAG
jgi:hypothetical protein